MQSAEIALDGVQQEATVGARTVLDVLDAEQELLDAQVSLVVADRNAVVAAFTLLSALGRLTAQDLGLPVEIYDYDQHYLAVEFEVLRNGASGHHAGQVTAIRVKYWPDSRLSGNLQIQMYRTARVAGAKA
ncbi:MAG: TolC family protein [Thalassobaculum sp.]